MMNFLKLLVHEIKSVDGNKNSALKISQKLFDQTLNARKKQNKIITEFQK